MSFTYPLSNNTTSSATTATWQISTPNTMPPVRDRDLLLLVRKIFTPILLSEGSTIEKLNLNIESHDFSSTLYKLNAEFYTLKERGRRGF